MVKQDLDLLQKTTWLFFALDQMLTHTNYDSLSSIQSVGDKWLMNGLESE